MKKRYALLSLVCVFAFGSLLCGCANEAPQATGDAAVKAANPDQSQMKDMYQKNKRGR